jgi:hypothetical protein
MCGDPQTIVVSRARVVRREGGGWSLKVPEERLLPALKVPQPTSHRAHANCLLPLTQPWVRHG